jgi:DNA (cytosine-5)-methyltransferase 1
VFTYASTFTGIGGFEQGFDTVGWRCQVMVEIDPHCQRVLARNYPGIDLRGDIRDVPGTALNRPDLLVGGFPCQDTSLAAPHRAGLAGSRSGLFWEFHRLLDEHLRLVDEARPRWVVIENPEGLLSSKQGRDMAAVASGLEDLGYGWAYRVVDGGRLGTAQRRRRVIVVGHRGGDPRPAWEVLGDDGAGAQAQGARGIGRVTKGPRPVAGAHGPDGVMVWRKSARARAAISAGGYETWVPAEHGNTLTGFDGGGPLRQTHLVAQAGRLRTLTLTEWERLQGFPDGWTAGMPESARYTALGNAIHTGTSAWLARRLDAVHAALPQVQPA